MNELLRVFRSLTSAIKTEIFNKVYTKSEVNSKIQKTENDIDTKVADALSTNAGELVDRKIEAAIESKKLVDEDTLANKDYIDSTTLENKGYITETTLNSKGYVDNTTLEEKGYLVQSDLDNYVNKDSISETITSTVEQSITEKNLITEDVLNSKDYVNTDELNKAVADKVSSADVMKKEQYDTDHDGIIDKAKVSTKIEGVESAPFFSVYGKSPTGVEGFYEFPIGKIDENTDKFQSVRQDAKANEVYSVDLVNGNKLNNLIIQAYEFVEGEQDIVTTVKEFNNSEQSNFYYDSNNVDFSSNGCKIKNQYITDSTLSSIGHSIKIDEYLDKTDTQWEVI